MTKNNEQNNLMELYPCQLKFLKLSCYGCCRNGVSSRSLIEEDIIFNNVDFEEIYSKYESNDTLIKFRDRYKITEVRASGVCRNLVKFEDGCLACPLHPKINAVVSSNEIIAPSSDLREGFCKTTFECSTVKFWNYMNLVEREAFVEFLKSKNLNNFEFSMRNISGELIKEFSRRRNEFIEFE